jgi:hypothetical protein
MTIDLTKIAAKLAVLIHIALSQESLAFGASEHNGKVVQINAGVLKKIKAMIPAGIDSDYDFSKHFRRLVKISTSQFQCQGQFLFSASGIHF